MRRLKSAESPTNSTPRASCEDRPTLSLRLRTSQGPAHPPLSGLPTVQFGRTQAVPSTLSRRSLDCSQRARRRNQIEPQELPQQARVNLCLIGNARSRPLCVSNSFCPSTRTLSTRRTRVSISTRVHILPIPACLCGSPTTTHATSGRWAPVSFDIKFGEKNSHDRPKGLNRFFEMLRTRTLLTTPKTPSRIVGQTCWGLSQGVYPNAGKCRTARCAQFLIAPVSEFYHPTDTT